MIKSVIKFIRENLIYKKGDIFSLFIFILFLNFLSSQFFINDLLRPYESTLLNDSFDKNSIQLNFDSDIILKGNSDSTYIVNNTQSISSTYQFKSFLLDLELFSYDKKFLSSEDKWIIDYYNKNKFFKGNIYISNSSNINPSLFLQFDEYNNTSYGLGLTKDKGALNFDLRYKKIFTISHLDLTYDDFNFAATPTIRNNSLFLNTSYNTDNFFIEIYNLKHSGKLYDCKIKNPSYNFNINNQDYMDYGFNFLYKIDEIKSINFHHINKKMESSADLIEGDFPHIVELLKINYLKSQLFFLLMLVQCLQLVHPIVITFYPPLRL